MLADPNGIDAWLNGKSEHIIYDAPVASVGEFSEYWHEPAGRLELELLGNIDLNGFDGQSASTLPRLKMELDLLENE